MQLTLNPSDLRNKSEVVYMVGDDRRNWGGVRLHMSGGDTITFWANRGFTRIQLAQMFQQMADLARKLPEEE